MNRETDILEISTIEVQKLIESGYQAYYLDVREPDEYENYHIPGTILMPLREVLNALDDFKQNEEYIIICRSGRRSGMVCEWLLSRGIQAKNMAGGIIAWQGEVVGKRLDVLASERVSKG